MMVQLLRVGAKCLWEMFIKEMEAGENLEWTLCLLGQSANTPESMLEEYQYTDDINQWTYARGSQR